MVLKKSDKIIAVIGVVILIVAGIGIVLYSSSDEENGLPTIKNDDSTTYDISYKESVPMAATPDNTVYSIKPKLLNRGISPYVGNVVINQKNLKSINFYLQYTDNVKGILGSKIFGQDTLSVNIKDSEDNILFSKSNKGSLMLNETIMFDSMISLDPIEAKDKQEAYNLLEERYIDYEESFKIQISLATALWGRFREILSTDTFKLEITYTFYEYDLEDIDYEPPDEPDNDLPPLGSNIGFGVYSATNFGLTKL